MIDANRKQIHEAAKELLNRVKNGDVPRWAAGICDNINFILERRYGGDGIYAILDKYFYGWKHYSGIVGFPVPDPDSKDGYAAKNAYYKYLNVWTGDYGKLRLDLLKYLLRQTR